MVTNMDVDGVSDAEYYDDGDDFYNYEKDYSYINPLEEISVVTKVMFAMFIVSIFALILICYCGYRCFKAFLLDPYRRCKMKTFSALDPLCSRDPNYRAIVYLSERVGLDPVPTYQEYIAIREDLASHQIFDDIFKKV